MKKALFTLLLFLNCGFIQAATYKVKTAAEVRERVQAGLRPNDTVVMANGIWQDAHFILKGQGTEKQPIVFTAETAGKVTLEGSSSLFISGSYIVIKDLWFKNGGVSAAVIEFRTSTDEIANDCRITNCVIDNYNQGNDRSKESTWIQFYGKRNRLDHCYIAGKKNGGVTLAVNLNDERHRENFHRIDHNIFGHRAPLGSNGGETIRIGVSTYSLSNSKTIVEDNYFYRCNGETEIISVKSCENILRHNIFYESEGSLVLRHGNRNIIEGNYFIGNNKSHTGGVRVINAGHRIFNNYFENLKGERFRSALAVMNAVPNSSLNRYHQVNDVVIAFNTFVNCDHITLSVGADNERTARPTNTTIAANVILNNTKRDSLYEQEDDITGITFTDNSIKAEIKVSLPKGFQQDNFEGIVPENTFKKGEKLGFATTDILGNKRTDNAHAGAFETNPKTAFDFHPTKLKGVGTNFFQPDWANVTFPPAKKTIPVPPQYKALEKAVETAEAGDVIELTDTATYFLEIPLLIKKPVTIQAKTGLPSRPTLNFKGEKSNFTFISIENGGSLKLKGINFNGFSGNSVAECAIRTSLKPMIEHYQLFVEDCRFYDFSDGRKSAFIAHKNTYADTIRFADCLFYDISGEALSLASEKDDKGIYNVEHLILQNCTFANLLTGALDLYRGGNDESTLGPFLTVNHCTFHNVGNVELGSVLKLMGVQWSDIRNTLFSESGQAGRIARYEDAKGTRNKLHHCNLYKAGRVESFYPNVIGAGITNFKPEFKDPDRFDFRQKEASLLKKKGTDGMDIGVN